MDAVWRLQPNGASKFTAAGTHAQGADCIPCDPTCDGCFAAGSMSCRRCATYWTETGCTSECPELQFPDAEGRCGGCSTECTDGCTGPGPSDCLLGALSISRGNTGCVHWRRGDSCVTHCDPSHEWMDRGWCLSCSENCAGGCNGAGDQSCTRCRHLSVGARCVSSCPGDSYANGSSCVVCDQQCEASPLDSRPDCHGHGPTMCTGCRAVKRGAECVSSCNSATEFEDLDLSSGARTCVACDAECEGGCDGRGPARCARCRNWETAEGRCVPRCDSAATFPDLADQICLPCHRQCAFGEGCPLGPQDDGCAVCAGIRLPNSTCGSECETGWYPDVARSMDTARGGGCAPCHSQCAPDAGCFGGSVQHCGRCLHNAYRGRCVPRCPDSTYVGTDGATCYDCNANCVAGCRGPRPDQCESDADLDVLVGLTAGDLGCRFVAFYPITLDPDWFPAASANDHDCRVRCPAGTHANDAGVCESCSSRCGEVTGCTGPGSDVGPGGCVACPLSHFLDHAARQCASCHRDCDQAGCTGQLSSDCRQCRGARGPEGSCYANCDQWRGTHYLSDGSGEPTCSACSPQCNADAGCDGPQSIDCRVCTGYRTPAGSCTNDCSQGWVSRDDESGQLVCRACSDQCDAVGGCTGPTADDCDACRSLRDTSGTCVPRCPAGQSADEVTGQCICDAGYPTGDVCGPCNELCDAASRCSGPGAGQCDTCAFARGSGSVCVPSCPVNEAPSETATGHGPACHCGSGAFDAAGDCIVCDSQCLEGCSAAGPDGCIGAPTACRHVYAAGRCTEACPAHHTADADKRCVCDGFVDVNARCSPCDTECSNGCSGPRPDQCSSCSHFQSGRDCVASCPADEVADATSTCRQCHPMCHEGCASPHNDTACSTAPGRPRSKRCAGVLDGAQCRLGCRPDRNFVVDCEHDADIPECAGSADRVCLPECPGTHPHFNDTRIPDTAIIIQSQLCVADCVELGKFTDAGADTALGRLRCVDSEAMLRSQSRATDAEASVAVEVLVAIGFAAVAAVVVGYVALSSKSGERGSYDPTLNLPLSDPDADGGATRTRKDGLGFTLPGNQEEITNDAFAPGSPGSPESPGGYLDPRAVPSDPRAGAGASDPYGMDNDAIFGAPRTSQL